MGLIFILKFMSNVFLQSLNGHFFFPLSTSQKRTLPSFVIMKLKRGKNSTCPTRTTPSPSKAGVSSVSVWCGPAWESRSTLWTSWSPCRRRWTPVPSSWNYPTPLPSPRSRSTAGRVACSGSGTCTSEWRPTWP